MNNKVHNQIVSYIWSIADDVLRDVFVRGKYRDIILPFTVLRRIDVLLEETKEKVLETNKFFEEQNIKEKEGIEKICDLFNKETEEGDNLQMYSELLEKICKGIMHQFEKRNTARLSASRDAVLIPQKDKATDLQDFELIT